MEDKTILTHVWQDAGLGRVPFQYVALISFPPRGLQESNIEAYNNALREVQHAAARFGVGLCICNYCGHDLQNNCVIRDADGKHFVVGCDCVARTGDTELITLVEADRRKHERKLAWERAETKRQQEWDAWKAKEQEQRERNGGLTDSEIEAKREAQERADRLAAIEKQNQPLIALLLANSKEQGDFCSSIAGQLCTTEFKYLSYKAQDIVDRIYIRAISKGLRGAAKQKAIRLAEVGFSEIVGRITPEQAAQNRELIEQGR